jgi:hypothetical protein
VPASTAGVFDNADIGRAGRCVLSFKANNLIFLAKAGDPVQIISGHPANFRRNAGATACRGIARLVAAQSGEGLDRRLTAARLTPVKTSLALPMCFPIELSGKRWIT